jgi:hypothetical protein
LIVFLEIGASRGVLIGQGCMQLCRLGRKAIGPNFRIARRARNLKISGE